MMNQPKIEHNHNHHNEHGHASMMLGQKASPPNSRIPNQNRIKEYPPPYSIKSEENASTTASMTTSDVEMAPESNQHQHQHEHRVNNELDQNHNHNHNPDQNQNQIQKLSQSYDQGQSESRSRLSGDERALVIAADACALCCLQCTGALVLLLYLIQIGLWSWAFHQIYTGMPQTFAWEKLLRSYGSHYDDCIDRSSGLEIELKPSSICPSFYTMPCIPIIAVVILLLNLFSGSSCLSNPKSKQAYKMVASSTTWQFLFTTLALVFASMYFHQDIRNLEQSMVRELGKGIPETTRWQLTQTVHKCCGIHSPLDWDEDFHVDADEEKNLKNETKLARAIRARKLKLPYSCYSSSKEEQLSLAKREPKLPLTSELLTPFKTPCYDVEFSIVRYWAIFEIALLCAGLVTTIFFFCLATAVHGGAREGGEEGQRSNHLSSPGPPLYYGFGSHPQSGEHLHQIQNQPGIVAGAGAGTGPGLGPGAGIFLVNIPSHQFQDYPYVHHPLCHNHSQGQGQGHVACGFCSNSNNDLCEFTQGHLQGQGEGHGHGHGHGRSWHGSSHLSLTLEEATSLGFSLSSTQSQGHGQGQGQGQGHSVSTSESIPASTLAKI